MSAALLLMALLLGSTRAWATMPTLPVAGAQGHLWLVQPVAGEAEVIIWHQGPQDPPESLRRVGAYSGKVARGGVAAAGNRLWLIYTDGGVASIEAQTSDLRPGWFFTNHRSPALPENHDLVAFSAGATGPWVLMRVLDAAAPGDGAEPDASAAGGDSADPLETDATLRILLGLPPRDSSKDPSAQPDDDPATEPAPAPTPEPADVTPPSAGAEHALFRLQQNRWQPVDLPEDWPPSRHVWVVAPEVERAPVSLVVQSERRSRNLRVYRRADDAWRKQSYTLPEPGVATVLAVQGQLVIAQTRTNEALSQVSVVVLRRGNVQPVGAFEAMVPVNRRWALVGVPLAAALVVEEMPITAEAPDDEPQLWYARMDLRGRGGDAKLPLAPADDQTLAATADYIIPVLVVVLAVLLMFVFWRRGAHLQRLALPKSLVLADFFRRGGAGLIDLAPPALLVMYLYSITLDQLILRWPGRGYATGWESIAPGLIVIGLFMLHVTLSELITTRSLGKAVLGLRVTDLRGRKPRKWQLLVRNLLKVLDLLAWLLLLLPIIGPYRQRLGDMLARTVVVAPAPPEETTSPDAGGDQ